ncbi:MAG: hypothetical protein M1480_05235 [Bacteroidetes bacterium]|nr:hypothetical protein [Bacteroidota bacterium]
MQVRLNDTYPQSSIAFVIELISIASVSVLTYILTKNFFYLFIPLPFILAVIGLINIIIKKTKEFYSNEIIFTFETIVVALLIATFAITGIYPWLFLPFFIQLLIVVLIVFYKEFRLSSEKAVNNLVEIYIKRLHKKAEDKKNDESIRLEIEDYKFNQTNAHYKKHKIISKIKVYGISCAALLFISIYLVWYFPYYNEKTKEEKNNSYNDKLIKKIDSLEFSIISLKDSLSKMMNSKTINRVGKQIQEMDSTQNYNFKPISHKNIK